MLLPLLACTCKRAPPPEPEPHYETAVDLRLAVESGDLESFKDAARSLEAGIRVAREALQRMEARIADEERDE